MKVITATTQNFTEEVLESDIPVFVDFWASWCAPCRMIGPFVEQIAKEYDGKLKVIKCDVDEHSEIAAQYKITSIPALLLFKNGEVVKSSKGAMPLVELKKFVEEVL